jgi:hypothetical protein
MAVEVMTALICEGFERDPMGRYNFKGCFLGGFEAAEIPSQSQYCVAITLTGLTVGEHSYTIKAIDPGGAGGPDAFTAVKTFRVLTDSPFTILLSDFWIGWTTTGMLRLTVSIDGAPTVDALRLPVLQSGRGVRLN